jgi:hypothetical protein
VKKALILSFCLTVILSLAHESMAQPLIRQVAFIDAVKFPTKAIKAHGHLRATVEDALANKGWAMVQGTSIVDCGATTECMAKIASETGANFVLRISGQKISDYGYEISLDLYSTASGNMRGGVASCDICDSARMSEIASKSTMDLIAKSEKEDAELNEKAKKAASPPVVARAPNSPPSSDDVVTPPKVATPESSSWVPWALIGTGALTIGYGGWALYKNDKSTGSWTPTAAYTGRDYYSSNTVGVISLLQ